MCGGELAPRQHLGAEQAFFELAHDDHPVDDLALTLQHQAVTVERDRRGSQVDRRRETAVELDLGSAVVLAELDGGEIKEAEVDRFLELVSVLTGQENR